MVDMTKDSDVTKNNKTKLTKAHKALWSIVAADKSGNESSLRIMFDEDQWCELVEAFIVLNDKCPEAATDG